MLTFINSITKKNSLAGGQEIWGCGHPLGGGPDTVQHYLLISVVSVKKMWKRRDDEDTQPVLSFTDLSYEICAWTT